jgi:hypothetical protein
MEETNGTFGSLQYIQQQEQSKQKNQTSGAQHEKTTVLNKIIFTNDKVLFLKKQDRQFIELNRKDFTEAEIEDGSERYKLSSFGKTSPESLNLKGEFQPIDIPAVIQTVRIPINCLTEIAEKALNQKIFKEQDLIVILEKNTNLSSLLENKIMRAADTLLISELTEEKKWLLDEKAKANERLKEIPQEEWDKETIKNVGEINKRLFEITERLKVLNLKGIKRLNSNIDKLRAKKKIMLETLTKSTNENNINRYLQKTYKKLFLLNRSIQKLIHKEKNTGVKGKKQKKEYEIQIELLKEKSKSGHFESTVYSSTQKQIKKTKTKLRKINKNLIGTEINKNQTLNQEEKNLLDKHSSLKNEIDENKKIIEAVSKLIGLRRKNAMNTNKD